MNGSTIQERFDLGYPMGHELSEKLKPYDNQHVTLGFRPGIPV